LDSPLLPTFLLENVYFDLTEKVQDYNFGLVGKISRRLVSVFAIKWLTQEGNPGGLVFITISLRPVVVLPAPYRAIPLFRTMNLPHILTL